MNELPSLQFSTGGVAKRRDATKYERALALYEGRPLYPVDSTATLIPAPDLPALIDALEAKTRPASAKELAAATGMIATAWPFAWQRLDEAVGAAFLMQLTEELRQYPGDVLLEVVRELRHSLRFAPSIAEICALADAKLNRRHQRLRLAQDHLREHERRAAAELAEAERQAAEERRQRAHLEHLVDIDATLFRDWAIDDVQAAERGFFQIGLTLGVALRNAIDAGEEWARHGMIVAAAAGWACSLYKSGKVNAGQAARAISLARDDYHRVRQFLSDAEAGRTTAAARFDVAVEEDVCWEDPGRVAADLIAELRREEALAKRAAAQ